MFERQQGRERKQLRPIRVTREYLKHPAGSVLIEFGDTKVLVTVSIEERVPRHVHISDNPNEGWLTAEYALMPGSTNTRSHRERQRLSGRTSEIQRLIGRSLRAAIDLDNLGQRTITIDADVIQADGGTRVAAITGAYIAVVDALRKLKEADKLITEDLPILSPVAAVSVGMIEGEVFLDLNYEEDFAAGVDSNIVMNADGNIIEFQATSEGEPFSPAQMTEMLEYADAGIKELLEIQQHALDEALATC